MSTRPRRGLNTSDPTPLYHQLVLLYRQKILSGALTKHDRLPSEEEMAQLHDVSRITAKRALNELALQGFVERNRGRGTTVSFAPPERSINADFQGLMESLVAIDATTDIEVISYDFVAAPPDVSAALDLPEGSVVQRVERRRMRGQVPFSHILTFVPEDIGRHFGPDDLRKHPILSLIEDAGHRIASARQTITAVLANEQLSTYLEIAPGSPLLQIRRIVSDRLGRPVQSIVVHYRPDIYELTMSLDRVTDNNSGTRIWSPSEKG